MDPRIHRLAGLDQKNHAGSSGLNVGLMRLPFQFPVRQVPQERILQKLCPVIPE